MQGQQQQQTAWPQAKGAPPSGSRVWRSGQRAGPRGPFLPPPPAGAPTAAQVDQGSRVAIVAAMIGRLDYAQEGPGIQAVREVQIDMSAPELTWSEAQELHKLVKTRSEDAPDARRMQWFRDQSNWHTTEVDGNSHQVRFLGQGFGRAVAKVAHPIQGIGECVLKVTVSKSGQTEWELAVLKAMTRAAQGSILEDLLPQARAVTTDGRKGMMMSFAKEAWSMRSSIGTWRPLGAMMAMDGPG